MSCALMVIHFLTSSSSEQLAAIAQIDSSSELNCPSSQRLAERLQGHLPDLEALLFHALEWADAAGSKRIEVILDERTHPTRSLLQPGLADFQGPGILIVIHGESGSSDFESLQNLHEAVDLGLCCAVAIADSQLGDAQLMLAMPTFILRLWVIWLSDSRQL